VYALFVATVVYREMKPSQIFSVFVSAAKTPRSSCSWRGGAGLILADHRAQIPQQMIALLEPFMGQPDAADDPTMLLVMAVGTART